MILFQSDGGESFKKRLLFRSLIKTGLKSFKVFCRLYDCEKALKLASFRRRALNLKCFQKGLLAYTHFNRPKNCPKVLHHILGKKGSKLL